MYRSPIDVMMNQKIRLQNDINISLTNFDSGVKTPSIERLSVSPSLEKASYLGNVQNNSEEPPFLHID